MQNLSSNTDCRYGIFGGTFDPVHNGHLIVATTALEALGLDKLYVVPAYVQPLKAGRSVAEFRIRLEWLQRSFCGNERIEVSAVESQFDSYSYTLLTVEHYSRLHDSKPFLIIGADSLKSFDRWYRYRQLLNSANLAVYPRNGIDISCELQRLGISSGFSVLSEVPVVEISSSVIRKRCSAGLSLNGFVPCVISDEVYQHYKK